MDSTGWNNIDSLISQSKNQRLYVHTCTMENTIRNEGTTDVLIEAYFIRGRRGFQLGSASDPTRLYEGGFRNQLLAENPDGSSTFAVGELAASTIGVTPWQNARFCANYTITKRIKFTIPPGGEISHILHGPSGTYRTASVKQLITDRKYTGVLYQQQGTPRAEPITVAQATSCVYLSVRRYRVKMLQNNLTRDAFDLSNPLRTNP
jgi:hypothetical protein